MKGIGKIFIGGEIVHMTTTKIIINEFENYIKKHQLTQFEAAKQIGCSPGHLSRILRGEKNPSINLLDKMEEVIKSE